MAKYSNANTVFVAKIYTEACCEYGNVWHLDDTQVTPHEQYVELCFSSFYSLIYFLNAGALGHSRLPPGAILSLCETPQDLCELDNVTRGSTGVCSQRVKFQFWGNCPFNIVGLPMLGVLSEKRFPYMLLASRKAPSSRTSSSIVAVWACSVLFMSFHDCSASGRSRLSTVCTTAWQRARDGTLINFHTQ